MILTLSHVDSSCRSSTRRSATATGHYADGAIDGPPHLPFFIDYANNGDRRDRLKAMYDRVGHTCSPRRFYEITISGSQAEMRDWLGPHDLPLKFVDGTDGIIEACIEIARGEVIIL
jgi:hypothetical protein